MTRSILSRPTAGVYRVPAAGALAAILIPLATPTPAYAERMENQVAVFAALDKVTARISKLEVPLGDTVTFGALKVTPRACYTRPPTEPPKTTTFVEVDEIEQDGADKRIFTGWMLAESPGLNAVEHPVFDVWLTGCEKPKKTLARKEPPRETGDGDVGARAAEEPSPAPEEDPFAQPRRRVRR